jgi:response regulator RpfG family c-di-GMP phosphodiesterase
MGKFGRKKLIINTATSVILGGMIHLFLMLLNELQSFAYPAAILDYFLNPVYMSLFISSPFLLIFAFLHLKDRSVKQSIEQNFLETDLTGIFIHIEKTGKKKLNYVNPSFASMFENSIEEMEKSEFLPSKFWQNPSDRTSFLQKLNKNNHVDDLEVGFKTKTGRNWWGRLYARKSIEHKQIKIQGTITDITKKREFEKVLYNYNENLEREILQRNKEIQEIQRVSILGLSKITEFRDPETGDHILRMAHYSRLIAEELGRMQKYRDYITPGYIEEILISAPLHDIGKVGIADYILKKPGKLTNEEFEIMKSHTIYGGNTIKNIENQLSFKSFLTLGTEIAYHHHQKFGGQGYPLVNENGVPCLDCGGKSLNGYDIPLSARIVSLADVYDALTSKRCYKEAIPHEKARKIILEESGRQFDPDIVDAFVNLEEAFSRIKEKYSA